MKNTITLLICFAVALSSYSQTKWFVSLSSGPGFGGPIASIKKNMEKSNLNHKGGDFDFFGISLKGAQYPIQSRGIPTLLKVGKKIKEGKSIYVEAGVSNRGEITGHQNTGNYSNTIPITFKVLQFTTGYQYSFPKTRSKIGAGPTLYVFNYNHGHQHDRQKKKYFSIVPGVSFMARTPIAKEKRLIGVDLMLEGNIAPPARMKEIRESAISNPQHTSVLKAGKVNMIHGMIGLALSYRK